MQKYWCKTSKKFVEKKMHKKVGVKKWSKKVGVKNGVKKLMVSYFSLVFSKPYMQSMHNIVDFKSLMLHLKFQVFNQSDF